MEIAAGNQIEALEGERVTTQQSSSKKKKNQKSKEREKADTRLCNIKCLICSWEAVFFRWMS
jgi:hypothetical protein